MAPSYHWLKLWIEILDDWKVAPLPDRLWRRFVECCLIAKKLDDGGYLESIEKMAFILRISPDALEADLIALERATRAKDKPGIIQCIDGRWLVTNLEKRQSRMSPAERKRKQRERDREQSRESHGDVTPPSQKVTTEDRGSEEQTTEDRGSEQQTTDGASAPDAVVALQDIGMGELDTVLAETQLNAAQISDTVAYAREKKLGAGWVRTQLRANCAHKPRAPDNGRDALICPNCSQHPCDCKEAR